jgi:spore germination cell wall hydrolase CwlJ-like protein
MKLTSNILIGMLVAILVAGLCLEGIHAITGRQKLENRLQIIEQLQSDIIEKQNYLFELMSNTDNTPVVGNSAIRVEQTSRTVAHEDLDLFCLAKNIFHEAGVEDELGMFAVAQVTINRVRNSNYPDSICDVVMQPSQFSWANDKNRRWTHPTGPKWELSKQIAKKVIKDGYRVPALQAAMFYHADYVNPRWKDSNAVIAQVGTHIFYTSAR